MFKLENVANFTNKKGNVLFNNILNTFIHSYMASDIW